MIHRFRKLTPWPTQKLKDVEESSFPGDEHSYTVKEEDYEASAKMVQTRRQIC